MIYGAVLGVVVIVVGAAWLASLRDDRRRMAEYASKARHELVARARELIVRGDPEAAEADTSGDFDPWEKNRLLALLSREDFAAMLNAQRPGGGWWYIGPYDMGPNEDMRRMQIAQDNNRELRLILTTLARRG